MSAEATPTVEITYTENPIVQSEPVTEIKIIKKDNNFSKVSIQNKLYKLVEI